MIDGAEEYRAELGSVRNAGSHLDEHLPVNNGRRSWLNSRRVHVKDRLQVAICDPVEVDDDGDSEDSSSHLREMNIASFSIQASPARIAWLEPSLD